MSAPGRPKRELLPLGGTARSAKGAPISPLARDVIVILAIKTAALALLWFAFFRVPAAPHMTMDSEAVAQHVLVAVPKAPHAEP